MEFPSNVTILVCFVIFIVFLFVICIIMFISKTRHDKFLIEQKKTIGNLEKRAEEARISLALMVEEKQLDIINKQEKDEEI